ncbi:hypothetical protein F1880_005455 [Penicillium rolfsii]|nr:hypothetical protein F1880_005455 [Penicillium rolfsii]
MVQLAFHGSALRPSFAWQIRHGILVRGGLARGSSASLRTVAPVVRRGILHGSTQIMAYVVQCDCLADLIGKDRKAAIAHWAWERNADHFFYALLCLSHWVGWIQAPEVTQANLALQSQKPGFRIVARPETICPRMSLELLGQLSSH